MLKTPLISLLIPTLANREKYLTKLLANLLWRGNDYYSKEIELLIELDNGTSSIGAKRNSLVARAKGKYICFIDDDDNVSDDYIPLILNASNSNADCASLTGLYFINGIYDRPFIHSLRYKEWWQDENFYYRCPNHLNLIKRELVKDILFEDKNFGEDGCWSMEIQKRGLLKTQFEINEILYFYNARSK